MKIVAEIVVAVILLISGSYITPKSIQAISVPTHLSVSKA